MKPSDAPDLGKAFYPSNKTLEKYAKKKADVIFTWLFAQNYKLLMPHKNDLRGYLKERMREQGRFVGLKIEISGRERFLKFPLGGLSAVNMALRESVMIKLIHKLAPMLLIAQHPQVVPTPYGSALMMDFIEGERLESVNKSDNIDAIATLVYTLQSTSVDLKKHTNPLFFGNETTPIHTWGDYERGVEARLEKYLRHSPQVLDVNLVLKIKHKLKALRAFILRYEDTPVFSHRDFFDKNIMVKETLEVRNEKQDSLVPPDHSSSDLQSLTSRSLYLVDFEHAAIVKNYALGLNFDLANIVVQWYRYPRLGRRLISLVREKHSDKKLFDTSLTACLIIQILAKIDPVAQKMTPGGIEENTTLLKSILSFQ